MKGYEIILFVDFRYFFHFWRQPPFHIWTQYCCQIQMKFEFKWQSILEGVQFLSPLNLMEKGSANNSKLIFRYELAATNFFRVETLPSKQAAAPNFDLVFPTKIIQDTQTGTSIGTENWFRRGSYIFSADAYQNVEFGQQFCQETFPVSEKRTTKLNPLQARHLEFRLRQIEDEEKPLDEHCEKTKDPKRQERLKDNKAKFQRKKNMQPNPILKPYQKLRNSLLLKKQIHDSMQSGKEEKYLIISEEGRSGESEESNVETAASADTCLVERKLVRRWIRSSMRMMKRLKARRDSDNV